ncbi:MAG: transglutaminase family protein [Caulobacteraceae bacterium]
MRIRAGYEITYDCPAPTPMLLMVNVRPERTGDLVTSQTMTVSPAVPTRQYRDSFGNVCTRLLAPAGQTVLSADFLIDDSGLPDAITPDAMQHEVDDLPDEVLIYLLGSRYCETDRLSETAWSLFGNTPLGWARVQAIVAYVHNHIQFGYEHANRMKSANDAWFEGLGVCRDFAHLAVALCRCMNIPARYCTGFLGDIGIPPVPGPMDFSAWFEAYLGGRWHTFDARHNKPRIARIMMAYGRDATDAAIVTTFGQADLVGFNVITDEVG